MLNWFFYLLSTFIAIIPPIVFSHWRTNIRINKLEREVNQDYASLRNMIKFIGKIYALQSPINDEKNNGTSNES